jgi:hypothetical protein
MQPDGVLDANATALRTLQSLRVIPYQPQPAQAEKSLMGIDNQLFNNLFSTNGFVILTSADDVDQIYYYEVNPVQVQNLDKSTPAGIAPTPAGMAIAPTPAASAPTAVYFASKVSNAKQVVSCPLGVVVGILKQVDYVQEKMVLSCIVCQQGMYLDLQRKACWPFPVIANYLN